MIDDVTDLEVEIRPRALNVQARLSATAAPAISGLSAQGIAQVIRDLHRSGLRDEEQEAVARMFEAVPEDQFSDVKYLLNSHGDHHDLERLVFDDLDEARRQRVLARISAHAREVGPSPDLRILCDIDDTVICSLHDRRYPRGITYPGIVQLLRALDDGGAAAPGRPGDLTFVTARPPGPLGIFEHYTRNSLSSLGLPEHTVMTGSLANVFTKASIASRKLENISRDRQLFPECRMVFLGDSGQADPKVALTARERFGDHLVAAFIHDVVGVPEATRKRWQDRGVYAVDHWAQAAEIAHHLSLISKSGLGSVRAAMTCSSGGSAE